MTISRRNDMLSRLVEGGLSPREAESELSQREEAARRMVNMATASTKDETRRKARQVLFAEEPLYVKPGAPLPSVEAHSPSADTIRTNYEGAPCPNCRRFVPLGARVCGSCGVEIKVSQPSTSTPLWESSLQKFFMPGPMSQGAIRAALSVVLVVGGLVFYNQGRLDKWLYYFEDPLGVHLTKYPCDNPDLKLRCGPSLRDFCLDNTTRPLWGDICKVDLDRLRSSGLSVP